jgi:hypothetical protein
MIAPLLSLPYTRTLFLDTDARLSAPVRRPDGWSSASVPALFPELNSGVLLMHRSWRQRLLVRRWLHLYEQLQAQCQQAWDHASLHLRCGTNEDGLYSSFLRMSTGLTN